MKKIINSIILIFFVINSISAQLDNNESMEKAGTAAAQFLKIPFDSKGSAMGNTGVSMPGTIGSSYWNPATIAAVEQNEFGILSAKWLADINIDFFGFILATKKFGNIGFNVFSLNTPEDDVTTIYQPDGTGEKWKASDISISISYGRKLSNNFSIGSNLYTNPSCTTFLLISRPIPLRDVLLKYIGLSQLPFCSKSRNAKSFFSRPFLFPLTLKISVS